MNEAQKENLLLDILKTKFKNRWYLRKIDNLYLQEIFNTASKRLSNKRGEPDLIYLNNDLLILIEVKDSIKFHSSKNKFEPQKYAVDGIKHYLSYFLDEKLKDKSQATQNYVKNLNIVGIAFSGDIEDEYNHKISTFIIKNTKIENLNIEEILEEADYISLFENIDTEEIVSNISKSSKEINRLLRNIDSQKRPILLSALMICLYDNNDFRKNYSSWQIKTILRNIPNTIEDVLLNEGISQDKIDVLKKELSFLDIDYDLNNTEILKQILFELENNVIPLFKKKTTYDIIGKFYEEFLRYTGVANVKKGIVLTPTHIANLFTELIDLKANDIVLDPTCGSGSFLISAMNKLTKIIKQNEFPDKEKRIKQIKENQLIGFEKSSTMYSLAISNMLFRGDGKSKIFNIDFFSNEAQKFIDILKPTIGFINPPYGGKDNKSNPLKKEIQFLEKLLDSVSRYVVAIVPLSTYFKDDDIRKRILKKHTLKAVINMPNELFLPNASTHTAIAVFETNNPHNNKKVIFYDLKEDGFVLSKNKGRTDVYNKWNNIKKDLLNKLKNPRKYNDEIKLVYKPINENDEWIIQAHMKIDYKSFHKNDFIKKIKEYIIFSIKKEFNFIFKEIDEITFMEILQNRGITNNCIINKNLDLFDKKWDYFNLKDIFSDIKKGERLVESERIEGNIPLITASSYNNGITSFIEYETFKDKKKLFEDKITIDMFANTFYHPYKYFSDDNIHTLIPFKDLKLNIFHNIFLITVLSKLVLKYSFGRQVRLYRLEKEMIPLPVKDDKPDWNFMQEYIKTLPYSVNL